MIKTWDQAKDDLSRQIVAGFKELLETKHLYQRHELKIEKINEAELDSEVKAAIKQDLVRSRTGNWHPLGFGQSRPERSAARDVPFAFTLSQLKTFCEKCSCAEAHNPLRVEVASQPSARIGFQVFIATFQCQVCRDSYITFLIERQGTSLRIVGRTPIEHVSVPRYIPKGVQQFYSQACIAYQSGYVLAGLFLLRTVIEQAAREATQSTTEQADQLMEEYMSLLALDFKESFPSLRDIYGRLSTALHGANSSSELFDNSLREIRVHFEGVDLFKRVHTR